MLLPLGILASASGGADYELISSTVLGSAQASVTFTDAGAWTPYKHLQIRGAVRSANAAYWGGIYLTFNADGTSVYTTHNLVGNGSGVSSDSEINATSTRLPFTNVGSSAPSNAFGSFITEILDFKETTKFKTLRTLGGRIIGGSEDRVGLTSGLWRSTNAVTSITMTSQNANFVAGSRFSLYGLKG